MNRYLLTEDKFEKFYDLYLYSFNRQDSEHRKDVFKERYDHSLSYGIMNGSKLGSGLFSIPFDVEFHGVNFKMNGIGDVMSAPEFGGQGGASTLMNNALEDMYQNQVTLSYLAPFSFGYYRQFGYEQVFDHTQITINNDNLPKVKSSSHGYVERLNIRDTPDSVKVLYSKQPHMGGLNRAQWWWDHMLDKHQDYKIALAYDDGNELIGYLIYYHQGETFFIQEWVNTNILSRQILSKFITKHQSIFQKFVYESPDPDFKADLFENPRIASLKVVPYMMARIVNLKDFIERYPIQKDNMERICFKVEDTLEYNDHIWSLRINNGVVDLQITDDFKADFTLTIQTLTKAMFGYRNLNSLFESGYIEGDFDKVNKLNDIFVYDKPQLIDYF